MNIQVRLGLEITMRMLRAIMCSFTTD